MLSPLKAQGLDPAARKWLMLWTLNGRPEELPWERFRTAPKEVFDYLPEERHPTLRDPSALSQVSLWTGRYPTLTITRLIFRRQALDFPENGRQDWTLKKFRVDMHPHFPTPENACRTIVATYKAAQEHVHDLVQRMETEHWNWRQT